MAGLGSLSVELSANIARFEASMNRAQQVATNNSRQIVKEVHGMRASFDAIPGAIAKIAASVGAFYLVQRGIRAAIETVDDFRVSVISIAATLTDMAKPGQGSMEEIFKRNTAQATKMYKVITLEAAKHFSSAQEGMAVYNRLVQSGYAVRLDEISAMLSLSDKIKLLTKGQDSSKQLNTEILALMQGQTRPGSELAMMLQSRLGPGWSAVVNKMREKGTLLQWMLDNLYPALKVANSAIEETLNAQWATLKGHLGILSVSGLGGAYDDIVGVVAEINEYLKQHGKELAGSISEGWSVVSAFIKESYRAVKAIYDIIKTPIVWVIDINFQGMKAFRDIWNRPLASGVRGGGGGGGWGLPGDSSGEDLAPPKVVPSTAGKDAAKGGKGGGGDGTDRMASIINNLEKDIAKLSQGSIAEIDAWAKKTIDDIEKVGRKGAETSEALALVTQVTALKKQKIEEDFQVFVGKESGDAYVEIEAQARAWLTKYRGIKGSETEINDIVARKKWETDVKQYTETLGLQQSYLNDLASALPLLSQQEAIKKKIIPLEAEIARYNLEQKLAKMQITDVQKDELRGLQALTAQAKKFNAEMEMDKGVKGWAYGRAKEADQKNTVKDMMGGLESGFQDAFSGALQGVLSKDKNTLKDIGKTMFQGLLGSITKKSITNLFGSAAKMLQPESRRGDSADGLSQAAEGLQQASVGFNTNTAQFGLAAGGLLLSGIGIAANSQALVYAGAVLQMVALAIQVYEMFTATTEMTALTTSAVALTGSATALTAAATALASAAGAGAAGSGGGVLGSIAGFVGGIFGFHEGGVIKAHAGWPNLKSDEVPIIAQTGERVLSRSQNRDYEAGAAGGGGGGISIGAIHIDARGASKDFNAKKLARELVPELQKQIKMKRLRTE